MNKAQELANKLQSAIETNNRIASSKKEVENLKSDIKDLDNLTKYIMTTSVLKQMRIDSLEKELENACEIDLQEIHKEIEALG